MAGQREFQTKLHLGPMKWMKWAQQVKKTVCQELGRVNLDLGELVENFELQQSVFLNANFAFCWTE